MKKKKLKEQVANLREIQNELNKQVMSFQWKLKLFGDFADPELLLLDYVTDVEPPIDITINMDNQPQYLNSGRIKVTMNLISKPKKNEPI